MDDEDAGGPARHARMELKMGDDVHVVLEGDPAFVMEAYQRVQDNVTRALVAKGEGTLAPTSTEGPAEPDDAITEKLARDGDLLWVYRCEDEMRTVYCTRRARFSSMPLVRAYGLGAVDRIYVEDDRILRALRRGARTLWRELEPEGLKRIQEAADLADTLRNERQDAVEEVSGARKHHVAPGPDDA